jgi:peptidoglycan/xylan/chitin deacetylase (PgdA/CDA1 family)
MTITLSIYDPPPETDLANPSPAVLRDIAPTTAVALAAYRYGSWPVRKALNAYLCWRNRAPVLSFFYHHVGTQVAAPWSIDFDTFREQVDWLAERFDMVSYAEAQRRMSLGSSRPCVHLTFDDGYADNCDQALPYLVSRRIPCTYFVTSWHVATGVPFAHDVARGVPLAVNTPAQIRELAAAGVEIGAHTRHHHRFSLDDSPAVLHDEIAGCRHDLEAMIGQPVRYFAFPYGTPTVMTPAAVGAVRAAGYSGFCSAFGGYNLPPGDPFYLQRIHGDRSPQRFYNWATLDPRKLNHYWQPQEQTSAAILFENVHACR